MKQSKLRRRRVIRYAILYFTLLVIFVALIVAPIVAGDKIPSSLTGQLNSTNLMQPAHQNNNDTRGHTQTGTGASDYSGVLASITGGTADATASATGGAKIRLF